MDIGTSLSLFPLSVSQQHISEDDYDTLPHENTGISELISHIRLVSDQGDGYVLQRGLLSLHYLGSDKERLKAATGFKSLWAACKQLEGPSGKVFYKRQRTKFYEFLRYGRLAAEMLEQGIELPTKEAQYRALNLYKMDTDDSFEAKIERWQQCCRLKTKDAASILPKNKKPNKQAELLRLVQNIRRAVNGEDRLPWLISILDAKSLDLWFKIFENEEAEIEYRAQLIQA